MIPRFSVRLLFAFVSLWAIGLSALYWLPKTQVLAIHSSYVGYYRGLGLTETRGYFGTNWYRIVVREDPDGWWEVDVDGLGYSPYRGYYGSGMLREEGVCLVASNGFDIMADRHDLIHGRFYNPQGELIAEVKDRTGKQKLCYANGKPSWELELLNGQYVQVRMWHRNGCLRHESQYQNGVQHGRSVSYFPNGQVEFKGEYTAGKKTGVWRRYSADGSLVSEIDEGALSPEGV